MRIVLDTNVIVSGFLNPYEAPGQLVQRVALEEIVLLFDARILAEYRDVLNRPKFGFLPREVNTFLTHIEAAGEPIACRPLSVRLPDRDDEAFLEVAISGHAEALVTGNTKHYPSSSCKGMRVLTPARFLDLLR